MECKGTITANTKAINKQLDSTTNTHTHIYIYIPSQVDLKSSLVSGQFQSSRSHDRLIQRLSNIVSQEENK